ncbi:MAG: tRNA (N(6)-L-threonylcarbamoyladenosine(37)-C(2))-methylthiotransferase MtaB, partial [Desulfobacterales bacterium]|nr:tRNA (N(6)-L-threonylcarbamoyladenosine(37)-C(2))-methylthiotransferase MtaB [Desulfobacterales bacterium]
MKKTFKIITLGCKVNQYESAFLREALERAGWSQVSRDEEADVCIVNTCIVTQGASYQSRQAIRKAIRENPVGMTAAVGCYAQVFSEELSKIEGLNLIAGNTLKGRLPGLLLDLSRESRPRLALEDFCGPAPFEHLPVESLSDRTRAFLKIQDGCESFCTYCIVPYARGPLRSLDSAEVVSMMRSLSEQGYKEVVLTGIHLGKYGVDLQPAADLKKLLVLIGKETLPLRVRLSSIEPKEVDQELIDIVASQDWLCRHFHLPLQSGDDGILKKMNRDYTAAEFARLVEDIHGRMPLAAIGVDVMAGFPGEDDRACRNTFSLLQDLPISYLHVFPFSPRAGTPAYVFPGRVDERENKKRTEELRVLGRK